MLSLSESICLPWVLLVNMLSDKSGHISNVTSDTSVCKSGHMKTQHFERENLAHLDLIWSGNLRCML